MDKYVFKPYDPNFVELFKKESSRLKKLLSKIFIEHIGSTSISGLGGKGIIDILIAVPNDKIQNTSKKLQAAGYEFRPQASTELRLFFRQDLQDPIEGVRRYHIHLTFTGSKDWIEVITFRDFLRTHPKELKRYQEIKKKAVNKAQEEGQKYRDMKEPFIQDIITKALNEKYGR